MELWRRAILRTKTLLRARGVFFCPRFSHSPLTYRECFIVEWTGFKLCIYDLHKRATTEDENTKELRVAEFNIPVPIRGLYRTKQLCVRLLGVAVSRER